MNSLHLCACTPQFKFKFEIVSGKIEIKGGQWTVNYLGERQKSQCVFLKHPNLFVSRFTFGVFVTSKEFFFYTNIFFFSFSF